jgi:hypothetical protein
MRRLPGPAGCRLGDGVKTPEAPFGLFRDWQRTPTQSSVRTLRSLRLQMDVRFCEMQEPPAERHCCVTTDSDSSQMRALPSAPGDLVFPLDNSTTWMSAIRKSLCQASPTSRFAGMPLHIAIHGDLTDELRKQSSRIRAIDGEGTFARANIPLTASQK